MDKEPNAIWECKIGEVARNPLPPGADAPLRHAVQMAYLELTGEEARFTFSGWGGTLTEYQRAVAENSAPHLNGREAFERWISSPPYEQSITRYPDDPGQVAWPGHYHSIRVQLAWDAWQAARGEL